MFHYSFKGEALQQLKKKKKKKKKKKLLIDIDILTALRVCPKKNQPYHETFKGFVIYLFYFVEINFDYYLLTPLHRQKPYSLNLLTYEVSVYY